MHQKLRLIDGFSSGAPYGIYIYDGRLFDRNKWIEKYVEIVLS